MQATLQTSLGATPVHATMSGTFAGANRTGALSLHETVLGHALTLNERFSGHTYYLSTPGLPGAGRLTGKPWVKVDYGQTTSALGVGGLSTQSSNPRQFLEYIRAVGAHPHKVGTGVDLSRAGPATPAFTTMRRPAGEPVRPPTVP